MDRPAKRQKTAESKDACDFWGGLEDHDHLADVLSNPIEDAIRDKFIADVSGKINESSSRAPIPEETGSDGEGSDRSFHEDDFTEVAGLDDDDEEELKLRRKRLDTRDVLPPISRDWNEIDQTRLDIGRTIRSDFQSGKYQPPPGVKPRFKAMLNDKGKAEAEELWGKFVDVANGWFSNQRARETFLAELSERVKGARRKDVATTAKLLLAELEAAESSAPFSNKYMREFIERHNFLSKMPRYIFAAMVAGCRTDNVNDLLDTSWFDQQLKRLNQQAAKLSSDQERKKRRRDVLNGLHDKMRKELELVEAPVLLTFDRAMPSVVNPVSLQADALLSIASLLNLMKENVSTASSLAAATNKYHDIARQHLLFINSNIFSTSEAAKIQNANISKKLFLSHMDQYASELFAALKSAFIPFDSKDFRDSIRPAITADLSISLSQPLAGQLLPVRSFNLEKIVRSEPAAYAAAALVGYDNIVRSSNITPAIFYPTPLAEFNERTFRELTSIKELMQAFFTTAVDAAVSSVTLTTGSSTKNTKVQIQPVLGKQWQDVALWFRGTGAEKGQFTIQDIVSYSKLDATTVAWTPIYKGGVGKSSVPLTTIDLSPYIPYVMKTKLQYGHHATFVPPSIAVVDELIRRSPALVAAEKPNGTRIFPADNIDQAAMTELRQGASIFIDTHKFIIDNLLLGQAWEELRIGFPDKFGQSLRSQLIRMQNRQSQYPSVNFDLSTKSLDVINAMINDASQGSTLRKLVQSCMEFTKTIIANSPSPAMLGVAIKPGERQKIDTLDPRAVASITSNSAEGVLEICKRVSGLVLVAERVYIMKLYVTIDLRYVFSIVGIWYYVAREALKLLSDILLGPIRDDTSSLGEELNNVLFDNDAPSKYKEYVDYDPQAKILAMILEAESHILTPIKYGVRLETALAQSADLFRRQLGIDVWSQLIDDYHNLRPHVLELYNLLVKLTNYYIQVSVDTSDKVGVTSVTSTATSLTQQSILEQIFIWKRKYMN
jgi:hypothetical protein